MCRTISNLRIFACAVPFLEYFLHPIFHPNFSLSSNIIFSKKFSPCHYSLFSHPADFLLISNYLQSRLFLLCLLAWGHLWCCYKAIWTVLRGPQDAGDRTWASGLQSMCSSHLPTLSLLYLWVDFESLFCSVPDAPIRAEAMLLHCLVLMGDGGYLLGTVKRCPCACGIGVLSPKK